MMPAFWASRGRPEKPEFISENPQGLQIAAINSNAPLARGCSPQRINAGKSYAFPGINSAKGLFSRHAGASKDSLIEDRREP